MKTYSVMSLLEIRVGNWKEFPFSVLNVEERKQKARIDHKNTAVYRPSILTQPTLTQ